MKNKSYTKNEIKFLKEHIEKFGADVCAAKLGRPQKSVISKCYREFGFYKLSCMASDEEIKALTFKDKFKELTIDFSKSDNPKELAYFLGYFWADGYIRSDKSLVLEIAKDDADDIEHIISSIATFSLYERIRTNRKPQKTFFYHDGSDEVANKLINLGKYPKTTESHVKILNYIPKEYIKYFIRGLIDGDGCLYISPQNAKHHLTQLTISGRYEQDWDALINFIKEQYGLVFKVSLRAHKTNKSSVIRVTDSVKIAIFLKEVYSDDDGIYLKRKFNKIKIIRQIEQSKNDKNNDSA